MYTCGGGGGGGGNGENLVHLPLLLYEALEAMGVEALQCDILAFNHFILYSLCAVFTLPLQKLKHL